MSIRKLPSGTFLVRSSLASPFTSTGKVVTIRSIRTPHIKTSRPHTSAMRPFSYGGSTVPTEPRPARVLNKTTPTAIMSRSVSNLRSTLLEEIINLVDTPNSSLWDGEPS